MIQNLVIRHQLCDFLQSHGIAARCRKSPAATVYIKLFDSGMMSGPPPTREIFLTPESSTLFDEDSTFHNRLFSTMSHPVGPEGGGKEGGREAGGGCLGSARPG